MTKCFCNLIISNSVNPEINSVQCISFSDSINILCMSYNTFNLLLRDVI